MLPLPHNSKADLISLRQHERFPEVPVITPEEPQASSCNLRKTTRFHPQQEMRPSPPVAPREQSPVPSQNSKGSLTPFIQLKGLPEIPVATLDDPRFSRQNLRRALWSSPHLKMRADSPDSFQEESRLCPHTSRGHLLKLEWNPALTAKSRKDTKFSLNSE